MYTFPRSLDALLIWSRSFMFAVSIFNRTSNAEAKLLATDVAHPARNSDDEGRMGVEEETNASKSQIRRTPFCVASIEKCYGFKI